MEATKRKVVKAALKVLDLDGLKADPSYQREVKPGHKKIIANFNENALGIPLVAEREDGTLWIVDGLQRITALRALNIKTVRAEVFASEGPEHEATVFKLVNMNRSKLNPGEQFKALLTSQDATAWEVKETVESCGFKLCYTARPGGHGKGGIMDGSLALQVKCVATLYRLIRTRGAESIKFALNAVKEGWPDDANGVNSRILDGMTHFYVSHDGVVDMERLVPRMQTTSPTKVMYVAAQGTMNVSDRAAAVAAVIEKVYRKNFRKTK